MPPVNPRQRRFLISRHGSRAAATMDQRSRQLDRGRIAGATRQPILRSSGATEGQSATDQANANEEGEEEEGSDLDLLDLVDSAVGVGSAIGDNSAADGEESDGLDSLFNSPRGSPEPEQAPENIDATASGVTTVTTTTTISAASTIPNGFPVVDASSVSNAPAVPNALPAPTVATPTITARASTTPKPPTPPRGRKNKDPATRPADFHPYMGPRVYSDLEMRQRVPHNKKLQSLLKGARKVRPSTRTADKPALCLSDRRYCGPSVLEEEEEEEKEKGE